MAYSRLEYVSYLHDLENGMENNNDLLTHYENDLPTLVTETPVITYALIAVNIAVYLLGQFLYVTLGSEAIFWWGAKYNPFIIQGQYWRLITPIFLHGGSIHLLVNAYSLYAVGPEVEKMYGSLKFIIIYFVAGILGNVASFAFCPAISLGASGAIFGLLGAMLYLGIRYRAVISSIYIINIVSMIALNLGYGFLHPQIDNYAHMGGLIGGYLSALGLGLGRYNGFTPNKVLALGLLLVLFAMGMVIGFC
jgi:rhomboid protease GluP